MKYLIYVADPAGQGKGELGAPVGSIESAPRELRRKLRERAVAENPALQQLASDEQGVRVVLVEATELEVEPLRGAMTFSLRG